MGQVKARPSITEKIEQALDELGSRGRGGQLMVAILICIAAVGMIGVMVTAPNVLQLLNGVKRKRHRPYNKTDFGRTLSRCEKNHYIERKQGRWRMTKGGLAYLHSHSSGLINSFFPVPWDGKWRLVFFDIPYRKRILRNRLRRNLVATGFLPLQKSVYVFPYECLEQIRYLKRQYRLNDSIDYAEVTKISHEKQLRKRFNIKR